MDVIFNASLSGKFNDMLNLSLIHISEPTRPLYISYAVFCLKKKKKKKKQRNQQLKFPSDPAASITLSTVPTQNISWPIDKLPFFSTLSASSQFSVPITFSLSCPSHILASILTKRKVLQKKSHFEKKWM
eukprot:TRINITY_DN27682_c0_g1_i1.p1 TRINITY_DN27682_c0_g1~~TRINITY_DN27682_c0_g1_i1.p1  ORF type:complete len:130 (+),score=22.44 TRINITY_DN27682_c0_g1_i1:286-675(+)